MTRVALITPNHMMDRRDSSDLIKDIIIKKITAVGSRRIAPLRSVMIQIIEPIRV